mmetsp:Transcript_16814/g.28384  ORF Transcript_16814/g.28384 Transcript_16814/m.28384 type:complete len:218 (+) Transcript_16814:496-1149(+)
MKPTARSIEDFSFTTFITFFSALPQLPGGTYNALIVSATAFSRTFNVVFRVEGRNLSIFFLRQSLSVWYTLRARSGAITERALAASFVVISLNSTEASSKSRSVATCWRRFRCIIIIMLAALSAPNRPIIFAALSGVASSAISIISSPTCFSLPPLDRFSLPISTEAFTWSICVRSSPFRLRSVIFSRMTIALSGLMLANRSAPFASSSMVSSTSPA